MPLRYNSYQTNRYMGHDITYTNYYVLGSFDDVAVSNGESFCQYDDQNDRELGYYLTVFLPSLTLAKYLMKGRIIFGPEPTRNRNLLQVIHHGRTDLVKLTAINYFNVRGDMDEFLRYDDALCEIIDMVDWFGYIGIKFNRITYDQMVSADTDDMHKILRYSKFTPEELLEIFCSDLNSSVLRMLIYMATDVSQTVIKHLIARWVPDAIDLLSRKKLITADMIEFADIVGHHDDLLKIISECSE